MKKLMLAAALAFAYILGWRHGFAYLATKLVSAMAPLLHHR